MNLQRALRDRLQVVTAAGARVTAVVGFLALTLTVASLALAEPKPVADEAGACAHFACNDSNCETAICPTTSLTADSCTESSECKGPLPKLCEICKDGKEDCAHWNCTAKKCEVKICQ